MANAANLVSLSEERLNRERVRLVVDSFMLGILDDESVFQRVMREDLAGRPHLRSRILAELAKRGIKKEFHGGH